MSNQIPQQRAPGLEKQDAQSMSGNAEKQVRQPVGAAQMQPPQQIMMDPRMVSQNQQHIDQEMIQRRIQQENINYRLQQQ